MTDQEYAEHTKAWDALIAEEKRNPPKIEELPDLAPLPEQPDDVVAVLVPTVHTRPEQRRKKRPAT